MASPDKCHKIAELDETNEDQLRSNGTSKYRGAAFLIGVSGISLLSGFGYAIGVSRKSDPVMFDKGLIKIQNMHHAGSTLALKALGWGTLFAFGGVAAFCGLVWKLTGAKDMKEFRIVVGNVFPKIPKNDPQQGRTEFAGLNDLLQYVIDEDVRIKMQKEQVSSQSSTPQND